MANIAKFHNRLGLEPVSADPTSPSEGELQYSDGTARAAGVWRWDGSAWVALEGSGLENVTSTSSATYNATAADNIILCDTTSNDVTVNLPTASGNDGLNITIKKTAGASNKVIIDGNASETIDGSTTLDMPSIDDKILIVSDGTNWQSTSRDIKVRVSARYDSAATFANATVLPVAFATSVNDSHGAYSGSTFTVPTGQGGDYIAKATIHWKNISTWNGGEQGRILVYKNGAEFAMELYEHAVTPTGGTYVCQHIEITLEDLVATDTISFRVFQNTGGAIALESVSESYNYMTIEKTGSR